MDEIVVKLPSDRDRAGTLTLHRGGSPLCGPFWVGGRAADRFSQACGNLQRTPALPGGDTPLGRYRVIGLAGGGAGTRYDPASYGPGGVIVLEPLDGDAALAEANGRFVLFIQGGGGEGAGVLPATDGSLRLADADFAVLLSCLAPHGDGVLLCCAVPDAAPDAPRVDGAAVYAAPAADDVWSRSSGRLAEAPAAPAGGPWQPPRFLRATVRAAAVAHGEYDPGGPGPGTGTHIEIDDGMSIEVPDGSHLEKIGGQITIVPDPPEHEEPAEPPVAEPPVADPPVDEPPVVDPPATEPPPPGEIHGGFPQDGPDLPLPVPGIPLPPQPPSGPQPISSAVGAQVAAKARSVAADYKARGVVYLKGRSAAAGGTASDCSNFVHDVLVQAGLGSPYVTAQPGGSSIANSGAFEEVAGAPQAGDIVVEQLAAGPNGWHMGVYLGQSNAAGAPIGMQMGVTHGAGTMPWAEGPWGAPTFYRPRQ